MRLQDLKLEEPNCWGYTLELLGESKLSRWLSAEEMEKWLSSQTVNVKPMQRTKFDILVWRTRSGRLIHTAVLFNKERKRSDDLCWNKSGSDKKEWTRQEEIDALFQNCKLSYRRIKNRLLT